jgi:hypothetical protein
MLLPSIPAKTFASVTCFRYGIPRNVAVKASYHAEKVLRLRYETSWLLLEMVTSSAYSQSYYQRITAEIIYNVTLSSKIFL